MSNETEIWLIGQFWGADFEFELKIRYKYVYE